MALLINANAPAASAARFLGSTQAFLKSGQRLNSNSGAKSTASIADNLKADAERDKQVRDSVAIQNLSKATNTTIENMRVSSSEDAASRKDTQMSSDVASEMASFTRFNMMAAMGVARLAQGSGTAQAALSLLKV